MEDDDEYECGCGYDNYEYDLHMQEEYDRAVQYELAMRDLSGEQPDLTLEDE